ncbi:hypothetical protein [Geomicrobium sediminis]|uniref:Uncharacterized protein n=1 Tax=Geomicrobium sediminis TaxID=1347788 RepID=A0ABS2PHN6_9BACL|nr:hypothetical protein [Geomicrobium sediminis]MBM7634942.1 hypothetical protein [Geomicrobium sediminis]
MAQTYGINRTENTYAQNQHVGKRVITYWQDGSHTYPAASPTRPPTRGEHWAVVEHSVKAEPQPGTFSVTTRVYDAVTPDELHTTFTQEYKTTKEQASQRANADVTGALYAKGWARVIERSDVDW